MFQNNRNSGVTAVKSSVIRNQAPKGEANKILRTKQKAPAPLRAPQRPAEARKRGFGRGAPWESLKGYQGTLHGGSALSHRLSCVRLVSSWNENAQKELLDRL